MAHQPGGDSEGVERTHFIAGAAPRAVYDVVVDFPAYPKLFPEITEARVLSTDGNRRRVEFRANVVLPVRYVLDLVCDEVTLNVDWSYVEGEIVKDSRGAWRFFAEGGGTRVVYRVALSIDAPLPGFMLRKITDGLVALSIPNMFASLTREVRARGTA